MPREPRAPGRLFTLTDEQSRRALMEIRERSGGGAVSQRRVEVTAWNVLETGREMRGWPSGSLAHYIRQTSDLLKPVEA